MAACWVRLAGRAPNRALAGDPTLAGAWSCSTTPGEQPLDERFAVLPTSARDGARRSPRRGAQHSAKKRTGKAQRPQGCFLLRASQVQQGHGVPNQRARPPGAEGPAAAARPHAGQAGEHAPGHTQSPGPASARPQHATSTARPPHNGGGAPEDSRKKPRRCGVHPQASRFMEEFHTPRELIPPEDAKLGGVTSEMARRCAEWLRGCTRHSD